LKQIFFPEHPMCDFYTKIDDAKFDHIISLNEKAEREAAVESNDAFAAAMRREIGRGRIHATAGTFIDMSPTYARRIRGEIAISSCGSPAAMCMDSSGSRSGTQSLK
jgi:hypothetical protein